MSKILFLTSSPNGFSPYEREQRANDVSERNGLRSRMRAAWPDHKADVLAIASDPQNIEMNDGMAQGYLEMFESSGLPVGDLIILDDRNWPDLDTYLKNCDVLILSGGHVPTENKFFTKIGLREKLKDYNGIVIGISAGTMNSADCVYSQPELPGESVDPEYRRYLTGLDLIKVNILPHYQAIKDEMLDGRRLYEDITYADSYGNTFYVLEDGSYLYSDGGGEIICGKAYRLKDGKMDIICDEDETVNINGDI